jgi:hypothetical protein
VDHRPGPGSGSPELYEGIGARSLSGQQLNSNGPGELEIGTPPDLVDRARREPTVKSVTTGNQVCGADR